ncbi:MAG: gamma-glutamyltransferase, partial [Pseudomonadota bacterium]|nr:gamma-glutamyltransferase [Pseudomonadota bacterium]
GDEDFVDVPVSKLLSRSYAKNRALNINLTKATKSYDMPSVPSISKEGTDTTHFSIIDKYGNRVSATLSINTTFGSGFVAGNTGVLLNNHMNDFALAPNSPNIYGLVGNIKNSIEPGKRPLSSMSPTFVEDDRGILVIGTPGGSRIISMVVLGMLEYLKEGQPNLKKIVSKPRLHHQYLPDKVFVEPDGFNDKWIRIMKSKGHNVVISKKTWGNMQIVFFNKITKTYEIANDPRGLE